MPTPKLRRVDAHWVKHYGRPYLMLRDPLGLSDNTILLPQNLAFLLELCDGSRDEATLQAALELRTGARLSPEELSQVIAHLDEALLLDNNRYAVAFDSALKEFRTAPYRPSSIAGKSYPDNPEELEHLLRGYSDHLPSSPQQTDTCSKGRVTGLVSPHIDLARGGPTYAQVWQEAAEAVQSAEIAIVFGTDHIGGERLINLTYQHYTTPWGMLPTARDVVDAIAAALGKEAAFGSELNHRNEHSIELAVLWLHYLLGKRRCEVVPILCGSFHPFIEGSSQPQHEGEISAAIEALQKATSSRRTLVVAAGDLAHVGLAFGDRHAIGPVERLRLDFQDRELMSTICSGDAEAFFKQIKEEQDQRRICGLPPIYFALRFLGNARGDISSYAQCPADPQGTSLVSVCGIVLREPLQ